MASGRGGEDNSQRQFDLNVELVGAARDGRLEDVKRHLKNGAYINCTYAYNLTPLHYAASENHASIVEYLCSQGANVNPTSDRRATPLHAACHAGYDDVVRILLSYGANTSAKDYLGSTPVRDAIFKGHSSTVDIIMKTELDRGLNGGHLELTNINLRIMGPPRVGKTAFRNLLLNWPAPKYHHSTPIATRPVRAIEQIADVREGNVWCVVNAKETLATLADAIKDYKSFSNDDTYVDEGSSSTSMSITDYDDSDDSYASDDDEDDLHISPASNPISHQYTTQMLEILKNHKESAGRHKATWINLLDSGGQPQFADISRAFLRGNSINIIVIKLTEKLSDKPDFAYSLNGKVLNAPSELQMTNLQMIQHFVRSVGCSHNTAVTVGRKKVVSKPYFVIVGTHYDKTKFGLISTISESIERKNELILSSLSDFRDQFIFYNDPAKNELIFPIDNFCKKNREIISALIRQRIISKKDVGFKVSIPVKWYMLDLYLKDDGDKSEHGVISMERCHQIGGLLSMGYNEIEACVTFLDSMSSCLHYKDILPNVVFTNPQYLLQLVTNLVRASFVNLGEVPTGSSLSLEAQKLLKEDGIFDKSLLVQLGFQFVPGLFGQQEFLELLKYLLVAAPVLSSDSIDRYFLPIVLPPDYLKREEREKFSKSCDPLIITFDSKLVPQGLFPSLIVSLLSLEDKNTRFFIDSKSPLFPRQLRYAVKLYSPDILGSVLILDSFDYIEVFFTGNPKCCFQLRKIIKECIAKSAKDLSYDVKFDMTILCNLKNHFNRHNNVQTHPVNISWARTPPQLVCSLETEQEVYELTDDRQRCWFIESYINDIDNVLPNGPLNEKHASLLIRSLDDIVEWQILGIHLGIKHSALKIIQLNNHFQIQTSRKDMIMTWLDGGNATREGLITALKVMDSNRIAEEIENIPTE